MSNKLVGLIACLAVLAVPGAAAAAGPPVTIWTRPPGSPGSWFLQPNWSAVVPNPNFAALVYEGSATVASPGAQYYWLEVGIDPGYLPADVNVTTGATLSGNGAYVGTNAGGIGVVTVGGGGSTWTNTQGLAVGRYGMGTLDVSGGGSVVGPVGVLGFYAGSTGTATVDGPGSSWGDNAMGFSVGLEGAGMLDITNGGGVTGGGGVGGWPFSSVGLVPGSTGVVNVDGPGSIWTINGGLAIGYQGLGILNITNGGGAISAVGGPAASAGGWGAGGVGIVTVDGAGSYWTTDYLTVGGSGTGTVDLTNGGLLTVQQVLTIETGGTVTINSGALVTPTVDPSPGGTLNLLSGQLNTESYLGSLVNGGGVLGPGMSPGILVMTGDYSQPVGTLLIEIGGPNAGTDHDRLDCMGTLILGGTLEVGLIGGFVPKVGQLFDILNWGELSGEFDDVVLPPLPPGRDWDTTALYKTGQLAVIIPEPASMLVLLAAAPLLTRRRRRTKR